jgi:tripartite ATP-independent transporter DctM subunit
MVMEAVVLFALFFAALIARVPVAFALAFASIVMFLFDPRLLVWTVNQRLFFGVDSFVLLAVPLFILAANIMNEARITERLIDLAVALVGWIRGGLGMVNVAASMVFAGVSGSSTADTAAVGGVLIPQMLKRGYAPGFTVAVTATSSVIGTIIPPSIQMIVWASLTNTSIAAMFLGGVFPGILIGLVMMVLVYIISRRENYPREAAISMRRIVFASLNALLAMTVPGIVIGGIVIGIVTATEAAVLAVLVSLALGVIIYRTITPRSLWRIFRESAELSALPLFGLASASVFSYLLSYYQLPLLLLDVIGDVPPILLLPFIIICWLIIGTFLDALPAMVLMVPLFAPSVAAAGIDPVHYGVASVIALAIGLVTPPYGLCLLLASAIANLPILASLRALLPFLLGVILVVVLVIFFPALTVWLPGVLL